MKKIFLTLASLAVLMTSCDDKLDIKPYGDSTLSTVDELETLLNGAPYIWSGRDYFDLDVICNNSYRPWNGVADYINNDNSLRYAYFTYDESIDRADLTDSDDRYSNLYEKINYMNTVISKVPGADGGTSERKDQIVAEARVRRAWYHFLLVGLYAQQYDEAKAEQLGGVPYVDNTNSGEEKTKLNLKKTYERILEDCSDEVLAKLIPSSVDNVCRFGLDFGYGVRARVLFQMKRYDEALKYAELALKVNSRLEDRSPVKNSGKWVLDYNCPSNYYLIYQDNSNLGDFYGYLISPEVAACIDPNDYVFKYYLAEPHMEPAWGSPYPTVPEGSLQSNIGDARWNVWGLRSESMYYIKAECLIRSGKITEGLTQLDKVRASRIENPEIYAEKTGLTEADAMKLLQDSKRFEFIKTFENFFDRKRWNSEEAYKTTIVRDLSSLGLGTYSLSPDSPIWVFPFPMNATKHNKSLTQNY
ncbi:RagB/SusD family nutrient uptake outer membrane protein [uncultured Duncaniella sp.]|uniref:RagB/SusD family nutrient uptake outer membrane protein n=1 Tax=uncultured Duncaniella sp. TaxID=2768039 RepID=UPI0025EE0F6F|nr:RagB/SusD family nutrient uptake outer membrane protein [uncultured Duncaniella sp.]